MAKKKAKQRAKVAGAGSLPAVLEPEMDAPVVDTAAGPFDLDDPQLPAGLKEAALASGGYPYAGELDGDAYEAALKPLQVELVKLQKWVAATGRRLVLLFEGRDAAGKGTAIKTITQYLNPRNARIVALPKPTEAEAGQWYFQRYVAHLPTAGEIVLFDRSWYNRAGVEPVMGFCTPQQTEAFLAAVPGFERMLVRDGIVFVKIWLDIGREMQLLQFHQRRHNPLKIWKLSPIDYAAMQKWDAYTAARNAMLAATDTPDCPWIIVRANDKRRGRLELVRTILMTVAYEGRDTDAIGPIDQQIVGRGPAMLDGGKDGRKGGGGKKKEAAKGRRRSRGKG